MYQNQEQSLPYGHIAAYGLAGTVGFAAAGRYLAPRQSRALAWARQNTPMGMGSKVFGSWASNLAQNTNPVAKMSSLTSYEKFDSGLGGRHSAGSRMGKTRTARGLPFWGDAKMYMPGRREANRLDKAFHKSVYKNTLTKGHVWKAPMATAFGLALINSEVEQNGYSGFVTGAAREFGMQFGGRAGMAAGSAIGHSISGGFALGGPIGMVAGMAIGAVVGDGLVDAVKSMSQIGKRWSLPDLGGNFKDSQMAQTMRQRSMNAIRASQFNVRSELGSEALKLAGL